MKWSNAFNIKTRNFTNCILYLRTVFTNDVCIVTTSFLFVCSNVICLVCKDIAVNCTECTESICREQCACRFFISTSYFWPVNHWHSVGNKCMFTKANFVTFFYSVILVWFWRIVELLEHTECCSVTNHFTVWIALQSF